jgi:GNAT superfamily N-acetyltransferase
MRRALPGGYELDDDRDRIDVDAVHRYLSGESYWATGRPRGLVERSVRDAARVIGLYAADEQVGFARIVSDGFWIAYLADVYVLEEHRGGGRGVELVREAVDNGPHRDCRWMLHTDDAHGLYARFGFATPGEQYMERRRPGGATSTP